jgi:hypothetical protein
MVEVIESLIVKELRAEKLGLEGTPISKGAALTTGKTTITHTAPGTPDFALQDLVQNTGFGFVTKDEGNTTLQVIVNLQARVNELEDRLQAIGIIA